MSALKFRPPVTHYIQRLIIGVLALTLVTCPVAIAVASQPKSGSSCDKQNQKVISKGLIFTCIKKGKKLIWSSGIPVPKPVLKTSSPVNSTTNNTQSEISTNSPLSEYLAIKQKAYENIRSAAESGNTKNVNLIYHIGNDFPVELRNIYTQQVEYSAKLYGTFFDKKTNVHIYMYTEKDADAITSDPAMNFNAQGFLDWFKRWSTGNDRQHNIGIASYYFTPRGQNTPQGYAGLALHSSSTPTSLRAYSIQVMPHEFFHVVQDFFIQSERDAKFPDADSYDRYFPPVFREGSANTISFALASNSFTDYQNLYSGFIKEKKNQVDSVPTFGKLNSVPNIVNSLKSIEYSSKNPDAHESSYCIGQLLFEWVIAEYGFDGYRKLIVNQLAGKSFEDNVKKSLGISLSQLYEKAAPHIYNAFN